MKQKKFDPFKNLKLDPYEQEIEDAIKCDELVRVKNSKKLIGELQKAAKNTLKKNKNINIRVNEGTLLKFKAKAAEEGIPYQTLIASLIHKYANNTL